MPNVKSKQTSRSAATRTKAKTAQANARRKNNVFCDKRNRGIALVAILAIIGISLIGIAVAALSQDLTINGTATVKGLNWDVHFANLDNVALTGSAVEDTAPTIDASTTKIGDYKVTLNRPGDAAAYDFEVVNDGDLDAEITSVTIKTGSGLTCTSTSSKAATICENLNYALKYDDGSSVAVGDELASGATRKMNLKLELSSALALDNMPEADVEVSGLEVVITYGQKTN